MRQERECRTSQLALQRVKFVVPMITVRALAN